MTTTNPYAPPSAESPRVSGTPSDGEPYDSLALYTTLAVVAETFFSVVTHAGQLALAAQSRMEKRSTSGALLVGFAGPCLLGCLVASIVFICIWMHRAARNLRGLGR